MSLKPFYIGKRLSYDGHRCTVLFIGPVEGSEGDWIGVEWDDPSRGKHSGVARGIEYFSCVYPHAGSFIRPSRPVDPTRTFIQALKYKYAGEEQPDSSGHHKQIRISGKEVEEIGFEKIKRKQATLNQLKRVFLDGLCLSHRDNEAARESVGQITVTCGNIIDLDLSNNLFEKFDEIIDICGQLPHLESLRLDGNRLQDLNFSGAAEKARSIFKEVLELSFESAFLTWPEVQKLGLYFTGMTKLSLLRNNLSPLNPMPKQALPQSLTILNLGFNHFQRIGSELNLVANLPNLKKLLLHQCGIKTISSPVIRFSKSLSEVDLSYNEISSWQFIDTLPTTFPGLTHLIISHNPLFQDFHKPEDVATVDLLVTARLRSLARLNNSAVSQKYRMEAETYYISVVARELEQNVQNTEAEILSKNPRYKDLCLEYETPVHHRQTRTGNPHALEAKLVKVTFALINESGNLLGKSVSADIPKELSLYGLIGQAGRLLKRPAIYLQLFYEKEVIQSILRDDFNLNDSWDSDEEYEDQTIRTKTERVEVAPSMRTIGTTFDGDEVTLFVIEQRW
jgi:tubulin-specific chaperone E